MDGARSRERTKAAMEQLRSAGVQKLETVRQIGPHAEAIRLAMQALHGRDFKATVDHECAFVFITLDR